MCQTSEEVQKWGTQVQFNRVATMSYTMIDMQEWPEVKSEVLERLLGSAEVETQNFFYFCKVYVCSFSKGMFMF